jgi:hypothetical protein
VSNTFASALWGVDFLMRAMASGVAGVNLHGDLANCRGYTPLCEPTKKDMAGGQLQAQPVWYSPLLTKALVGDRVLRSTVMPSQGKLDVWMLMKSRRQVHAVVVNHPGSKAVAVSFRIGRRFHSATILSLAAPQLSEREAITLGGMRVGADGKWNTPDNLPYSLNRRGKISVTIAPSSAALITLNG